jgi:hypothetical protein
VREEQEREREEGIIRGQIQRYRHGIPLKVTVAHTCSGDDDIRRKTLDNLP